MPIARLSEQRARTVTKELLTWHLWDLRPVSSGGQLLEESEYRHYDHLLRIFEGKSKTGPGYGKPDFLLVDSAASLKPLVVIDTKPRVADMQSSIHDTQHYAQAIHDSGKDALAVAVAGAEKEVCEVRVQRLVNTSWHDLTLHGQAIDWIPSPQQTSKILSIQGRIEVAPERPPDHVLAQQANRLNEILRECNIKDELRPIYAAAFMLGLWAGDVSTDSAVVLEQINANARRAMESAHKAKLSTSLQVNASNRALSQRAWQIIDILEKLSIRTLIREHDYLGQLYETFFKYTGGNTIGQYFTPRHLVDFMCDLVQVTPKDIVFDPACGTGGFLIGALNRMVRMAGLGYEDAVRKVRSNIFGIESEPTTAALCVANMILRGDGKSGIIQADCFEKLNYPSNPASCALLNPPFPHKKKKTTKPATAFIDRAIKSLKDKGIVAAIVPYSLLANVKDWHRQLLRDNRLLFVATMPADLFNPYSNYDTAIIMVQKGVPHQDNRVFFCRLSDDGYKMKKAMRIPHNRGTSQLAMALDTYDRKKEKPEFSAFRKVTKTTREWSPETFIESAPHDDASFIKGFEESVRRQAAFYIRYGHRLLPAESTVSVEPVVAAFSAESNISLAGVELGKFRVSDYFTISLGGKDEIEDLDEGSDPFVSTSEWDNGVATWKSANEMYSPPAITVATDGSAYASFVQEFPFYAFYKVAILKPIARRAVPVDALYYVSYLLNREEWRFVRARKFGKARIKSTELYGPATRGEPDFEKMAELTRRGAAYPVITSFRTAFMEASRKKFSDLSREWKANRKPVSSASRMAAHPAYRQIVRMGETAVPFLLAELQQAPDHWFHALHEITGADPVQPENRGEISEMANAWIAWGVSHGFIE